MRSVFGRIWKLIGDLQIKEMSEILFIFQFEEWIEKEMILMNQLLSFNKALVVFHEFDGHASPEQVNLDECPFWV